MTREEQIGLFIKKSVEGIEDSDTRTAAAITLAAGIHWADQHPAWVSVEEELPKERGHYLAYTEYGQVWLTEYMQDKGGYWDWFVAPICVGVVSKVTHWMPLPTPPAKKGGEE